MQKRVKQQEEFQTELMTLIPYVRLTKQLRMTNLELETDLIKAEVSYFSCFFCFFLPYFVYFYFHS